MYYAHHEKEVAIWRCKHHQMHRGEYRDKYFKNFEPSESVQYDDTNRLYSVDTLFMNSAHFSGAPTRNLALNGLNWLINKYREDL
jgi:hypothetical protein